MTAPARRKDPEGATDNGAGVAALLAVAEALKGERPCPTRCAFAFFGAEENGLNGSRAYAASLDTDAVARLLAMVNYDTIAGVTSDTSTRPTPTWLSTTAPTPEPLQLRSQGARSPAGHLPATATLFVPPSTPATAAIPEGETGSWSDHAPSPAWGAHRLRGGYQLHHQRGRWL